MTIDIIRRWLNAGNKDYYTGVAIVEQFTKDDRLIALLNQGENEFRLKRLHEEILTLYRQLSETSKTQRPKPVVEIAEKKTESSPKPEAAKPTEKICKPVKKYSPASSENIPKNISADKPPVNPELYNVCKLEADNEYKKVMNTRAVLFEKATPNKYVDVNKPDFVFERGELAIAVVTGWQKVSELYDRAEFVRVNARLPEIPVNEESEFDHLPKSEIFKKLDLARKAYSKLKNKEQTPERIALMQKHEANIQKLKAKWDSLRQQQ